jgi:hypothetical protein
VENWRRNDSLAWTSGNRVQWDEAKPHMTALHLRKSTGAMSIRPQLVQ